ncbi:unknown [Clostridium sp. CAG:768]|nr:unknown [Clostridium sp. CAG:768]
MSDNEIGILILIVVLLGGGLMLVLLFTIFKDLIFEIFNLNYDELKSNLKEVPQNIFTVQLSSINYLLFRGFWVTVEIYFDFIIFKIFNRALVVKDFSNIELTGKFTSSLIVTSGNTKLKLSLPIKEYEVIKEFLEEKNV